MLASPYGTTVKSGEGRGAPTLVIRNGEEGTLSQWPDGSLSVRFDNLPGVAVDVPEHWLEVLA